ALEAGRAVTTDALAMAAWADHPPPSARHTIATHVLRLRRAGLTIATVTDGYQLDDGTDAQLFERQCSAAGEQRDADAGAAAALWRDALALWRGPVYTELDHVPEVAIEAARLSELAERAKEDLLAAELEVLAPDGLIADARQLVLEQ